MAVELQQSPPEHCQWTHHASAKKGIGTGKIRDVALALLVCKRNAAFCCIAAFDKHIFDARCKGFASSTNVA